MTGNKAPALAAEVLRGDVRAAARLISWIEAGDPRVPAQQLELFPHTGRARVLGVTGPPGVGKSTLVRSLIAGYRALAKTVGVLAVDPSSPFTGGALLGDRIRMGLHAGDPGVFIRSMASRGQLGGIALATPAAIRVLDAMGFDRIIVETVGIGQSEIAVSSTADCTMLVLMPGAGDSVQAMKAGVMEIGDVFVINKADHADAETTQQQVELMLHMRSGNEPQPPVLRTRADRGEGISAVIDAVEAHLKSSQDSGRLERARREHLIEEAMTLIGLSARRRLIGRLEEDVATRLLAEMTRRERDPASVAEHVLLKTLGPEKGRDPYRP
ncbi:MAG: methylmalonyl Co-A mutase-associated GTPase MeaB [Panacagrimonas sp.]